MDSIAGEIAAHDDTYEISYLNGQSGEGIFSIMVFMLQMI